MKWVIVEMRAVIVYINNHPKKLNNCLALIKRLFSFAPDMKPQTENTDKKTQIIYTAEQLFSKKGFNGTSVREIAKEAGINIAMISYYFGSKEKLMEAVFERRSNNVRFQVEALLQDEKL